MIFLTERQKEVLELSCKGLSIREICQELGIKNGTAKSHLTKLFRLFKVNNRVQLLIEAIKSGMIPCHEKHTQNDPMVRRVRLY